MITKIKHKIRNIKYLIKMLNAFRKTMYGSFDYTDTMLEINFLMLVDFVDNGQLDIVDWDSDAVHKDARETMKVLYEWWTIQRPAFKAKIDELYEIGASKSKSSFVPLPENDRLCTWEVEYKENAKALLDMAMGYEDVLYHIENDMLQKLISIRHWLWT